MAYTLSCHCRAFRIEVDAELRGLLRFEVRRIAHSAEATCLACTTEVPALVTFPHAGPGLQGDA
jgi:hypothetical protein